MVYIIVAVADYGGGSLRRMVKLNVGSLNGSDHSLQLFDSPGLRHQTGPAGLAAIPTTSKMKYLLDVSVCMAVSPTVSYERDPKIRRVKLPSAEISATTGQEMFQKWN